MTDDIERMRVQEALNKKLGDIETDEAVRNIQGRIGEMNIDDDGEFDPTKESIQNSIDEIGDETKKKDGWEKFDTKKKDLK